MRYLRAICRIIAGVVFIISGYFKAVDPVGTELKIREYMNAFDMGGLKFAALPLGILLCATEFLIGVCILKGIRMRLFSKIALGFISFFSLVTLLNIIVLPINDCGCFGDIIKLTNLETFIKNIVLLVLILFIFLQRSKCIPIATRKWENIYIIVYLVFILGISLYSLIFHPLLDFGQYRPGTDLAINNDESQPEEQPYSAVFIYKKNGESKEFDIDHLPDSTWTYVDTRTIHNTSGSTLRQGYTARPDFQIKNAAGEYLTEKITGSGKPIFIVSLYNASAIEKNTYDNIVELSSMAKSYGADFFILSGDSPDATIRESSKNIPSGKIDNESILYTDYKTAISLNRINGGLVYMNSGIIVHKWGKYPYPTKKLNKIISTDYQVITAMEVIRRNLFMEISVIVIFFMITIIRFVSKRKYLTYYKSSIK